MIDTQQKILNALASTSAAVTIQSSELFLNAGDLTLQQFTEATNALYESKKINKCFIQKDGIGQNVYWLTGFKGIAQTLQPTPVIEKEQKAKLAEPKSWTALKNQSPVSGKSIEEASMSIKNKTSKTDAIKKMIDAQPGISLEELIFKLVGDTSDHIELRKASDMVTYTIKRGGYTKKISPHNGTKRFYNNNAAIENDDTSIDMASQPVKVQFDIERHNSNVKKLINDASVDNSMPIFLESELPKTWLTISQILPSDPKHRKAIPLTTGVLDYFPDALIEVAKTSKAGNDQHNPGQPLHWSKEKSTDHADCITRHLIDRGQIDDDGCRHSAKLAWRALALLQIEIEGERKNAKP